MIENVIKLGGKAFPCWANQHPHRQEVVEEAGNEVAYTRPGALVLGCPCFSKVRLLGRTRMHSLFFPT